LFAEERARLAPVTIDKAPTCAHHEHEIRMDLRTIHTDASRPDEAIGQFECPECGSERRIPMEMDAA
jgi:predicted RNA-binding Zn-ribbon protein involved in translation (DUF1610 family)